MKKPIIISMLTLVVLSGAALVPSVEKSPKATASQATVTHEADAALIYRSTQMPSRSDTREAIIKAHRNIQRTPVPKPRPKPRPVPVVRETAAPVAVVHHYSKPVQHYVAPPQPSGSPKAYAESQVGSGQFSCLESLWNKESGWNTYASNPSSGAYGIPQALPGSKMASAGSDWQSNPITQINWGLGYIRSTYGTPCNAWAHSQANGWY